MRRPRTHARVAGLRAVRHVRHAAERGMMLLEVLVAMAILAMMTAAVWSSFSSTAKAIDEFEEIQDRYATVRSAMNRMASEVSMAYLSFNRPNGEVRHFTLFEGREDFGNTNLTFSTFAHLRMRKDANESDQSVVQYFLDEDPEDSDRTHLYRRETRRLHGDLPEELEQYDPAYVLLEDVEKLEFGFWNPTEQKYEKEWQTTVRDLQSDRLPKIVRIKIGIKSLDPDDDDLEFFNTSSVLMMREKLDLSKQ